MKLPRNLGFMLLGAWLILTGLEGFVHIGDLKKLLDILAIAAGVFLVLSR